MRATFANPRISSPPSSSSRPSRKPSLRGRAPSLMRTQAFSPVVEAPVVMPQFELDKNGVERLKYSPQGHNKHSFQYNGEEYTVDWVKAGTEGPPVLLVHGFGASTYHWRYQLAELSKTHRVWALDLLGFGLSDKALVQYSGGEVWVQQVADFIEKVCGEKVYIAGNSLGGFVSLKVGTDRPDLVRGVILLNAAGRFEEELGADAKGRTTEAVGDEEKNAIQRYLIDPVLNFIKRVGIAFAFYNTKRPERIEEVLLQVYKSPLNVDQELVESIRLPAQDPNAPEVFYSTPLDTFVQCVPSFTEIHRVIDQTGSRITMNTLLNKLDKPLFLLWGKYDPWIKPSKADLIQKLYPAAERLDVEGGHCPHDDVPAETNKAMMEWIAKMTLIEEKSMAAAGVQRTLM